jgi:hypothetical protein
MTKLSETIKLDKYMVMKSRTKRLKNFYKEQSEFNNRSLAISEKGLQIAAENHHEACVQTLALENIVETLKKFKSILTNK